MRVLSGIQPSGKVHLGNYLAMMKPAIEMQSTHEVFLFIANYHALTSLHDADLLRENTLDAAIDLLACGLEPKQAVFYRQSDVPEVHELAWLLSSICPMGLLERCHSFKDKTAKGIAASHGLFAYPVLMASDILAVRGELVPVGRDQKQHLEVTRDLAHKFNSSFAEVFTMPEPMIADHVAVVPGIDGQKMSKSYNNTIDIFAADKPLKKAIMKIVTDSKELEDVKDPDSSTIMDIYKLLADESQVAALEERFRAGGMGYGHAKTELLDVFHAVFDPYRGKRVELAENLDYVEEVLQAGATRAREEVSKVLSGAREAMGLA